MPELNLSVITIPGGIHVTREEDLIHLSVRIDKLYAVTEIRLYLDVDRTLSDFTRNVYEYAWSANDLAAAIQGGNAVAVPAIITEQQNVVLPRTQVRDPNANSPQPITTQLALGNDQWLELYCRVGQMLHIGTDPSRSLANVTALEILVQSDSISGPLTCYFDSLYLMGGFPPDTGDIGTPYVYFQRFRSSTIGAKSNPSPPTRYGVSPRRQRVLLIGETSPDPQVDKVDWFRQGGTLTSPQFVGSAPNVAPVTFNDVFGDDDINGIEPLEFDNYQPWPTTDLPRAGTCNVAGTSIEWVSGDTFNLQWAPGSQIQINGTFYTLYAQPASTTRLEVVENAGAFTGVPFTITDALIQGTSLPTLFGPAYGGFYFAVGDSSNQGILRWTKGNNPDVTSDANFLLVTSASEPLMNGFVRDGIPYVFSSDNLYRIDADFQNPNMFRPFLTPCGRGLWSRWAFCQGPEGTFFLGKDGLYLTANGSPALSLTDEDLYSVFPHDGGPGRTIGNIRTPDMTNAEGLRLAYVDGSIYFDYPVVL